MYFVSALMEEGRHNTPNSLPAGAPLACRGTLEGQSHGGKLYLIDAQRNGLPSLPMISRSCKASPAVKCRFQRSAAVRLRLAACRYAPKFSPPPSIQITRAVEKKRAGGKTFFNCNAGASPPLPRNASAFSRDTPSISIRKSYSTAKMTEITHSTIKGL